MIRSTAIAAVATLAIAAFSHIEPAEAATVNFTSTLNLSGSVFPTFIEAGGHVAPATVAVGDDITIHLTFDGGLGVAASNINFAAAYIYMSSGQPQEDTRMVGSFSFLDQSGSAIFTLGPRTLDESSTFAIGEQFCCFGTGPITFYGIEYAGSFLAANPDTARVYEFPQLSLAGSDIRTVPAVTSLPASLPLLVSAVGCLAYAGWRRRSAAS